ncbi:DUF6624 domain-containing protein [Chitinophaga polysaccharea]|uniref:DUF6624 domain-containing protein n=1 Tax=Chitinophaga polysaccharea TaxID=1293035 RepID=UPI0011596CD4|nr:DUF6624 domain-containing protein [Chitinophaga polysaccharea]
MDNPKAVGCLMLFLLLSFNLNISAQTVYYLLNRSDSLYRAKNFKMAADMMDKAISLKKGIITKGQYYDAACYNALAGQTDKAFQYLNQSIQKGFLDIDALQKDADLISLHAKSSSWNRLLDYLKKTIKDQEQKLNLPLKSELEVIYKLDQQYRLLLDSVQKKFGANSAQLKELWFQIDVTDSINLSKVKRIIQSYGWPGKDLVGTTANRAVWLTIQHADITEQKKYIPLLEASVKKGQSSPDNLAFLVDRINVEEGKPQIYGSQFKENPQTGENEFLKIEDIKNVNKRRETMGLEPIEVYAERCGVKYSQTHP